LPKSSAGAIRRYEMRIAGSLITFICGIVVVVGIFLPWVTMAAFTPFTGTGTGWWLRDLMLGGGLMQVDAHTVTLVLIGGILMIVFSLPCLIVSIAAPRARAVVMTLGIFAALSSLVAGGGAIWFIATAVTDNAIAALQYGLYVSMAGAVLGGSFAVTAASASGPAPARKAARRPAPAPAAASESAPAPEPQPAPAPVAEEAAAAPAAAAPVAEEVEEKPKKRGRKKKEPAAEEAPVAEAPEEKPKKRGRKKKEQAVEEAAPVEEAPVAEEATAEPVAEAPKEEPKAPPAEKARPRDEDLPMVQQSWETAAEFRARKKRMKK
jgi:hypothetical protein